MSVQALCASVLGMCPCSFILREHEAPGREGASQMGAQFPGREGISPICTHPCGKELMPYIYVAAVSATPAQPRLLPGCTCGSASL